MTRSLRIVSVLSLLALSFASCAKEAKSKVASRAEWAAAAPPTVDTPAATEPRGPSESKTIRVVDASRKVIHNGGLTLRVDDVPAARLEIQTLVDSIGGHVSSADMSFASDGSADGASLVLRVPSERFDEVRARLAKMGRVLAEHTRAQDVTEEYTDVQARLANARRLESRLHEIVSTKTTTVTEVLEVERELGRVRGEIEQLEGRIKLYDDQLALGTLSVTLTTEARPVLASSPSLGEQAGDALSGSWGALRMLGRGLLLFAIAILPWLPILAGLLVLVMWVRRRVRRGTAANRNVALAQPPPPAP